MAIAEYVETLDDLEHARTLLVRLLDLPESNLRPDLERFDAAMKKVAETEEAAKAARQNARRAAHRMYEAARRNWTTVEIKAATGY